MEDFYAQGKRERPDKRYLPKAAWASMTKEELADDKKKAAGDKPVGHQVENQMEACKEAAKAAMKDEVLRRQGS